MLFHQLKLFDCDTLGEVPGLIDICAFQYGHVIGQQLHWHGMHDRRGDRVAARDLDDLDAGLFFDDSAAVGKHIKLAAASADFLEVRLQLLQQFVIWGNRDDRHVVIDERQRAMLELARRVALCVDVRNLFQFQCTFKGDREMAAAAEEKCIVFLDKVFGHPGDRGIELQGFFELGWKRVEHAHNLCLDLRRHAFAAAECKRQEDQVGELVCECLGGRDANLRAGVNHQAEIRFAHQCRVRHIAQAQTRQIPLGVAERREGVGRFARLGDGDEEGLGLDRRRAIADFTRDLDGAGQSRQLFDPVSGYKGGVIAAAARDDLDGLRLGKDVGGTDAKSAPLSIATSNAAQGFLSSTPTMNAVTAPMAIMPSTPRLRTPAFSARSSPSAAR